MRLSFLIFIIFLLSSCNVFKSKLPTLAKADPDYMSKFSSFENVQMYVGKNLKDFVNEFKNIEDSTYVSTIDANGIISAKILIDKNGKVKDINFYNTFDDNLTNKVIKQIKSSKFKPLSFDKVMKPYSILVTYRFNKGKILCPLINGVPFPDKDQCNFNNPIKFFNVDEKPVLIEKLVPIYPDSDKYTGNQGTTVTTITIDQNGFVEYAQIYKSISNSIDQASIDAAMKLKFEPGKDNSRFVKVKMNIPFMFSLE